MKKIKATEVITVGSGIVGLTDAQARPRLHNLKQVKKGKEVSEYEVVSPIQFKAGEEFTYSGEVNKGGALRDPEAEALAKLEAEDRVRAQTRAQVESELAGKVAAAKAEYLAALVAKLPSDIAETVQRVAAELK